MTPYNYIDETGNRHGCWKVLARGEDRRGKVAFTCECVSCSYHHPIVADDLRRNPPRCPVCVQEVRKNRACSTCGNPGLAVHSYVCDCGCDRPSQCSKRRPYRFRTICVTCFNKRDSRRKARASRDPVTREASPLLLCAPFVEWLRPYVNAYGAEYIAQKCEVDTTGLRRIINGQHKKAQLDTIDKILCAMGAPGVLRDLYPELYEFTPKQMQDAEVWAYG